MTIEEKDFVLEPVSSDSNLFDLRFYKKVKKRDTGKFEIELGDPLYGLTLSSALQRIAMRRTAKKYEEENITLSTYLKELIKNQAELRKLVGDETPEKFDTGD
jgi:hypothetical protein